MNLLQRDPALDRAASGVRAIAILVLLPAVWLFVVIIPHIYIIIAHNYMHRFERAITEGGMAVGMLMPGIILLLGSFYIRRGRAWAFILANVVLAGIVCLLLLILFEGITAWVYEYGHPVRDYEKNLIKLAVSFVAFSVFLVAVLRCLLDVRRGNVARRLLDGPRGFDVGVPQSVVMTEE